MKYRIEVLNDKDFEALAKDLLEAHLGIKLQTFKGGKDKGIDLRYAKSQDNELIVQAKHYVHSTFADLKYAAKREKEKMDKLDQKPSSYIFFTSFDLNVDQTDEIASLLKPYVSSVGDVFGRSWIESMIEDHPAIEQKHYKLWLTSTNVLQRILHNGVTGRSEFAIEHILKRLKLYVPTGNFREAADKIKDSNFLMITGEPGVGKTTIAHLLACELLADGFELIYVDERIRDAEDLLSPDPAVKQLVLFDDFLGSNINDVIFPKNSASKIILFIERIMASKNKYLIMTSRTTILNQAKSTNAKLRDIGGLDYNQYNIQIRDYSLLNKGKILYNHLYHTMSRENTEVFFRDRFYLKVIKHANFFPRLIEFITKGIERRKLNTDEAGAFIERSLNNPSEIWHDAFSGQLGFEDQFLLCTLFSMGGSRIEELALHKAFEERYSWEISNSGHKRTTDAYKIALKKLTDGFIRIDRDKYDNLEVGLLNPSIADFLLNFYKGSEDELKRLFFSARYLEQLLVFIGTTNDKVSLPKDSLALYYKRFVEMASGLDFFSPLNSSKEVSILFIYLDYFLDFVDEAILLPLVKSIDFKDYFANEFHYYYVLEWLLEFDTVSRHIKENWQNYFSLAFQLAVDETECKNFVYLLKRYDIPIEVWTQDKPFFDEVINAVNRLYLQVIPDLDLDAFRDNIWETFHGYSSSHASTIIDNIIQDKFNLFVMDCGLDDFSEVIWDSLEYDGKAILNERIEAWEADSYHFEPSKHIDDSWLHSANDEEAAIDLLFERGE
ncbi:MAG: hypothetical protein EOO20_01980 [Chryseobacterium sp.]|nr:MAG: hypothetical protein EOO20_01980 [Chryseobacterium sp.]